MEHVTRHKESQDTPEAPAISQRSYLEVSLCRSRTGQTKVEPEEFKNSDSDSGSESPLQVYSVRSGRACLLWYCHCGKVLLFSGETMIKSLDEALSGGDSGGEEVHGEKV
jgi:hypothetical protein